MSELLEFAARLIELEGGALEPRPDGFGALLPASLATAWGAREELELCEQEGQGERFAYGTELLERMIQTATQTLPTACARLHTAPLRTSQIRSAADQWRLRNGVVEVGDIRVAPQTRLWIDALATLNGDEKRELLTSAALSLESGTLVEGFVEAAAALTQNSASFPRVSTLSLAAGMRACVRQAEQGAHGFRAAMTRRFERDRLRIETYFEDLLSELDKRAHKGRLDPAATADKQRAMLADRAAKLEALAARFVLRVEVQPVALRYIEVDGGFVTLRLRRRKASRLIELEYDAATRKLVPPPCAACGEAAVRPAACDDAVHLLCESCAPRAEGRIACAACKEGMRDSGVRAVVSSARGSASSEARG
jgi:hypothetical protein